MEIKLTILGLAKNNNGFFKSDIQAKFLITQLDENDGCIGFVTSGYNSCALFAKYDDKGITEIVKQTTKGPVFMFQRKVKGVLTTIEEKNLKSYQRKIKKLKKKAADKATAFESGKYNGTYDPSTYDESTLNSYSFGQSMLKEQIENLDKKIQELTTN